MSDSQSSFFYGTAVAPEVNSTDALLDELEAQVATVTAANTQAQQASSDAIAAANNAAISEANVATLSQEANDTLSQANTALAAANAAVTSAQGSATAAAGSASAASASASAASSSQTAAASSATTASTAATNAGASQTAAASSASSASTSATSASTSASNASASATTATTQATNSSNSATSAAGSATTATTQAGIATTQASNASTSATNASGYATAASTSATAAAASATLAQNQTAYLSGRNRIINGDMRVAQRASQVVTNNTTPYGGPDRWKNGIAASAGGQFTQSQGTITYGGVTRPALVQTVNTAVTSLTGGNQWNGMYQVIEGFNVADLIGQQVTLSFIFLSNVSGLFSVALQDSAGGQSYVSSFSAVANTALKVSITTTAVPSAASIPNSSASGIGVVVARLNTGTAQTSTLNSWQGANVSCASGAVNWAATAGNFVSITDVQLEAGSVSDPLRTAFVRSGTRTVSAVLRDWAVEHYAVPECCVSCGFPS